MRLARVIAGLGIDTAVSYALLTKGWQAAGGAVTLLLIAYLFSPDIQGYYYTFGSLIALQIFLELGLFLVITSLASHEWSYLALDGSGRVTGDAVALSRLASLLRFIGKWYSSIAAMFVIAAGLAGNAFFSSGHQTGINWQAPWWAAVFLAGAQLWIMPLVSLLEGCNQVVAINRFRFVQAIIESLITWALLASGAKLWVVAGVLTVRTICVFYFLFVRYRGFFLSVYNTPVGARIDWRREIWPMQWRLGMQGIFNYFMFSMFSPVMFYYHGPAVAGRMGMTWQIINLLQQMSLSWVQTKVPQFGMLVANRDFSSLDKLWIGASARSFGFFLSGALAAWCAVLLMNRLDMDFATRVLEPLPTALFLAAVAIMQVSVYEAVYLRAHKREPFMLSSSCFGIMSCFMVWWFGAEYGPTGAGAAYFALVSLFLVPVNTYLWVRRRAEWQA